MRKKVVAIVFAAALLSALALTGVASAHDAGMPDCVGKHVSAAAQGSGGIKNNADARGLTVQERLEAMRAHCAG